MPQIKSPNSGRPICTTPDNAPPLIKQLVSLAPRNNWTEISKKAGVDYNTVRRWRRNTYSLEPRLFLFDFVLRVIGYKLAIVPIDWEPNHVEGQQQNNGTTICIPGIIREDRYRISD